MTTEKLYQGPIFVKKSPIHGYGVFAAEDISEGSLVEECYPLYAPAGDILFSSYYFKADNQSALPLGFGCIYNHSLNPNVTYFYTADKGLFIFKARRFIHRGEELLCSYGKNWFDSRKIRIRNTSLKHRLYNIMTSIYFRFLIIIGLLWEIIQLLQHLM